MRRFFSRFFRERDAAADQLHELEHQGAGQARTARFFGNLLVVLFSLASFVFLGKDALANITTGDNQPHDHTDFRASNG